MDLPWTMIFFKFEHTCIYVNCIILYMSPLHKVKVKPPPSQVHREKVVTEIKNLVSTQLVCVDHARQCCSICFFCKQHAICSDRSCPRICRHSLTNCTECSKSAKTSKIVYVEIKYCLNSHCKCVLPKAPNATVST